jgi:ethanolamine utilization microcompartment shell protein EutS
MTLEEALSNITPTVNERNTVITGEHLIDDYVLGRNIAKYGLKFTTVREIHQKMNLGESGYLWHQYTITPEEKVIKMKEVLKAWQLI